MEADCGSSLQALAAVEHHEDELGSPAVYDLNAFCDSASLWQVAGPHRWGLSCSCPACPVDFNMTTGALLHILLVHNQFS